MSTFVSLETFLVEERSRVEAGLHRALGELLPRIPEGLRGAVRDGVLAGGKRLRPILCATAYRVSGGPRPEADELYDLAVAVELVHAYSLMHDDLPCMDDAPLRRGAPTPHTVYGEEAVMVAGAVLIPGAGLQAWRASRRLGLDAPESAEIVRSLARAAGGEGMVGGQALDLLAEGRELSGEALDELHRRKTAALLTAPLRIGALAARAEAACLEALEGYGRAVGLAFQIADDVLDATATARELGKNPSDAALGKSTYARLLGVEGARARAFTEAGKALAELASAGVRDPALTALARYAVERGR